MLQTLVNIEKDARNFGFDWPNIDMIFDQILSEVGEVKRASANKESRDRIQEGLGDLIGACISLCVYADFDAMDTVDKLNKKFATRIAMLKKLTKEGGLDSLRGQSIETMLELWHEVKKLEKIDETIV